jgi:hypothetical protein
LSGHHVWLVIFIGAVILPSSAKFYWQDARMDEDVENFYGSYIVASTLKSELIREGQVVVVQIRKPKGIGETFEEKLE